MRPSLRSWLGLALWLAPAALGGGVVTNSSLSKLYTALLGGGHVTFTTSSNLTFTFVAPIEITKDTVIDATTTTRTISFTGGNQVRLFTVRSNATLTLLKLSLVSGLSTNGGAIYNEGGVVLATDCLFRGNAAVGPDGAEGAVGRDDFSIGGWGGGGGDGVPASGGAIQNLGRCELVRCRFENNRASGGNGGDGGAGGSGGLRGGRGGDGGHAGGAHGGALYNAATLLSTACTFEGNSVTAGDGGAGGESGAGGGVLEIPLNGYARAGAEGAGGAIFTVGTATFVGCTFHTNSVAGGWAAAESNDEFGWGRAGKAGGTVRGGAIASDGTLALTNCTLVANVATGGHGADGGDGRVFRAGRGGDGGSAFGGAVWSGHSASLVNVTVLGGAVTGGTGGQGGSDSWDLEPMDRRDGKTGIAGGGNVSRTGGSFRLENCIVAHATSGGNGYGELDDAGHNLSSDDTCDLGATGSRNNTDPETGDLGDYGGSTETVPLLAGSPAINGGAEIPGLATDQRGVTRPQGSAFDIGAFERPFAGLSGHVRRSDGGPYPGVTLTLLSVTAAPQTTTSETDGEYVFTPLPGTDLGIYRIVPALGDLVFRPASLDVELTSPSESITNLDFTVESERIVAFELSPEGLFRFRFFGQPSTPYRIQASSPMLAWEEIGAVDTDADGYFDFTDSSPPTAARFYRVVAP